VFLFLRGKLNQHIELPALPYRYRFHTGAALTEHCGTGLQPVFLLLRGKLNQHIEIPALAYRYRFLTGAALTECCGTSL